MSETGNFNFQGHTLLDEQELEVVVLAMFNNQDALGKMPWVVIERLIKRGILQEVWRPFDAHYGNADIRLVKNEQHGAKQSTNRI